MSDDRDILIKCRQQASVCKAQGFPESYDFLSALADEIERLRAIVLVVNAADSVVLDKGQKVNGHG